MATFQKRNGRVTATVRIKPHPAKSKTFDTMRDAKKWAQEIEVSLKNEKEMVFTHILFKDALIEYRDTVSSKKRGSKQEVTKINFILKNMFLDLPLAEVTKDMMIEWREKRLEFVKGATVRREMIVLSAFFNWCIEVKLWLQKTPLKEVKLPKDSDHRERIISDEEINTLLPLLSERTKNIFLLALETGMRQAEICNLTWDRVHLDKSYLVLDVTKNGRFREVPLSLNAIEIFKSVGVKKTGSVFGVKSQDVSTEFMKARIKAGLYGFTFHDSRHTAATKIALKIPLLDLCKMFGWSSPKRAMIYYNPTASEIAARLSQP
ncbi:tyrosine-type recombinase/integrase [Acinetobacter nosocomialis]|uniref:tyrosine-type recombinase/integrase n=1 Tax=Acinetobacter nosocomialis TaxID=106654 RepID=UPI001B829024|nr:site-specific integrase [Acinetobacter nosocomialis]MBR7715491.1 site-specific integrase [Acinetobacter nosocomialis]